MNLERNNQEFEELNRALNDDTVREAYKLRCDGYATSTLPTILGTLLILLGNTVYGKMPSYGKFRAIEVIARVPYQSWTSVSFTLLTVFFRNEAKALQLSRTANYAERAQSNETMHVVVITQLGMAAEKAGLIRHTFIPTLFAFFYFWASYLLYLVKPRYSYELNYLFEQHAYEQYQLFLATHRDVLLQRHVHSAFLDWYGRHPQNQYEFFTSVRNDELIHRNASIEQIEKMKC